MFTGGNAGNNGSYWVQMLISSAHEELVCSFSPFYSFIRGSGGFYENRTASSIHFLYDIQQLLQCGAIQTQAQVL
jgi:hypothetical protein